MTTTLYLVRHGDNDWLDQGIPGRISGVDLNEKGRAQAEAVAEWLSSFPISQIYSSPLERAQQSAEPLAKRLGLEVRTEEDLNEVDFGEWNGCTFGHLDRDPRWKDWNQSRSQNACPGGEAFVDVYRRVSRFLRAMRERHPNDQVAAFFHGDPIKTAVMSVLSVPMDFVHRIEIYPASVTIIELGESGPKLVRMNVNLGNMEM